ncbi:hypothetical protein C8J57DRAFT_1273953 [Mycena rebaudengoi]|nr:hypothetical protein C8J57DRAFT_1273953 [Mycena rebaudengoi]
MDTLVGTGPHFTKLLAAHAMFVNSGDRICSGKDGIRTGRLRTRLGQRNPQTGYLLWGPNEESHVLVLDFFENIDGWLATQTMKCVRGEPSARFYTSKYPQSTPAASVGTSRSYSTALMTPRT